MGVVWVRGKVDDSFIEAEIEGWVDSADWDRACYECVVPVHVMRVVSLRINIVGTFWFPIEVVNDFSSGAYSYRDLEAMLRRGWLSDSDEWRLHLFGHELREIRPPAPLNDTDPLFDAV